MGKRHQCRQFERRKANTYSYAELLRAGKSLPHLSRNLRVGFPEKEVCIQKSQVSLDFVYKVEVNFGNSYSEKFVVLENSTAFLVSRKRNRYIHTFKSLGFLRIYICIRQQFHRSFIYKLK